MRVYFDNNLVNIANQLLNTKSTFDNKKAVQYLEQINNVQNADGVTVELLTKAFNLHKELLNEYPEINLLNNIAMQHQKFNNNNSVANQTDYEAICADLQFDKYGVLLSVLWKHGVVSDAKNMIIGVEAEKYIKKVCGDEQGERWSGK